VGIDWLIWRVTSRNWMGWPTERRHRLTGRVQHILYNKSGKRQDRPAPTMRGVHGR